MPILQSHEPATGALLWEGATGDVEAAVAAARDGWADWAARPLTVRVETLRRFANVVRARAEPFADLLARETGKPLWEARAELDAVIAQVNHAVAAHAERAAQRRADAPMGTRVAVRHKPHGVLAVLGPFNAPVQLPAGHILPALIAGNAVVFKPSEKTPATGETLVACLREAGVPEPCVGLVIGGPDEGRALAAHPGIDGLLFTGAARTGMALARRFAASPDAILALEMGGNNPLVAWDTPDIPAAAAIVVQSAFGSAGQRCTAARRLIVEDGRHEALVEAVAALAGRLIVDHPHAAPAPFMGPVIDNATADGLGESFLTLLMRGGRVLRHLARPDPERPFLHPAIIDVTALAERPDVELFGPILQVIRVPDFATAIATANATRYGLCATLLSQTPALYDRFWAGVRAGAIHWNRPTTAEPANAPLGGIGWSGNHRPGDWYAPDHCAYPVVSSEADAARAAIGVGLRDP